jgi:signal transduction histidine kinase
VPPSRSSLATAYRGWTMALNYQSVAVRNPAVDLQLVARPVFETDFLNDASEVSRASRAPDTSESIAACSRLISPARRTEALRAARPRAEEFLDVFSHEVRNSLAAIYNAAHLLRMQRAENAVALKAGMLIERQVGRMRRLIDDLSDITRVCSDELSLKCERIDLCVVARNAIDTLELDISARSHRLAVSLPHEPVWLQADAGRLEQVLVNLLSNAAKYTDPGGRVWLSMQQTGEHAIVCVRDSGIGIAADILPQVFKLYMQAEPASRRAEAGLGIGLALVRSLVELHGGTVTAASGGLGHGSAFTVCLPLAAGNCAAR